jgi:rhodanese-related sulfurtransferase
MIKQRHIGLWTLGCLVLGLLTGGCSEVPPEPIFPVTRQLVLGYGGLEGAPLVIDVRTAEEFETGHVPGAINIPHLEVAERIGEILPHSDKGVVLYCRSGRRAAIAAEPLLAAGVPVGHLEGDMLGWQKAGLPIVVETSEASERGVAP